MAAVCRLRPIVSSDLPALAALERASFSDPWTRAMLADALAGSGAVGLVAEDGAGLMIGSLVARVVADEAEVLSIAVLGRAQRQGIGRQLLNEAVARFASMGADTVWLEVRASNQAALALYDRAGFTQAGVRRGYYRRPVEDALVLRLQLAEFALESTNLP